MISITLKVEYKGHVRYSKRTVTKETYESLKAKIGRPEGDYLLTEIRVNEKD